MNLPADFNDMLSALHSEGVEFLLVGGYAVMLHTEPRYTKDIDLWVRPTRKNAEKVLKALKKFGAPRFGVSVKQLSQRDLVLMIGVEPVRIDLLTSISGVEFSAAWRRRAELKIGKQSLQVLSVKDLIINKRKLGRPQDLIDVQKLTASQASSVHGDVLRSRGAKIPSKTERPGQTEPGRFKRRT